MSTSESGGSSSTATHSTAPVATLPAQAVPGREQAGPTQTGYRPEIQGLRAVAVGLVVLFHLWPLRLRGGYVGVDVFFVISGYLITSHIFREVQQTGSLKVTRFWARRIRRLLPASLLVLAISTVGVLLWAPSTIWQQSARQIAASSLYIQNWALAFDSVDYMALDNVPTVAQHYWSLSVEEQFYAVWPLLIVALLALQRRAFRRTSTAADPAGPTPEHQRRMLIAGLAVLALASLAWSTISTSQDQAFAYMSTFTRAWEFAAGAITGLVTMSLRGRTAQLTGWVGAIAIVISGYVYTESSAFPGWIALVPVLGTVAVILAGRGSRGTAGWWLSLAPARFIGDISYSIYLIHWPLIVLTPYVTGHPLSWSQKVAILGATVVLAWLSKTFVEDPLRTRPLLAAAPWRAFAFAVAGMLVLVSAHVGISSVLTHRESVAAATAAKELKAGAQCAGPAALDPRQGCSSIPGTGTLVVPPEVVSQQGKLQIFKKCQQSLASGAPLTCDLGQVTGAKRTVALLGDSHASALTPLMDELGKRLGWHVIAATKSSCPATTARRVLATETSDERQKTCEAFNAATLKRITADRGITDVFVTSFTTAYTWANQPGGKLAEPGPDGYAEAWKQLTRAGKRVHVIRDVPGTGKRAIPSCLALAADKPSTCDSVRASALPPDLAAVTAKKLADPAITVLDLTPQFCDAKTCYARVGNVIVYRDTSHISVEYARLLEPYLQRLVGSLPR